MFSNQLYFETKTEHDLVDRHPFLQNLNKSNASQLYIDMNFKVLRIIETSAANYSLPNFFQNLYRHVYYLDANDPPELENLLQKVKKDCVNPILFLSQVYMWYLGLINGGQYVQYTLYTSDDIKERLFKFENGLELEKQLKEYINKKVILKEDQQTFIENVKETYKLIKCVFDSIIS